MAKRILRFGATLGALGLVLALPACGRDSERAGPSGSTTTTTGATVTTVPTTTGPTTTAAAPATTTPECPPGPASTEGTRTGAGSGTVLLNGLLTNHSDCLDAVVFTFRGVNGAKPGWQTEWVRPPFVEDPSGRTLPVKGSVFLRVRIAPAYGYDFENGEQTYTGAGRVEPPPGGRIQEVVRTGDYEGVLSFVIGLDRERSFEVQTEGGEDAELIVLVGD